MRSWQRRNLFQHFWPVLQILVQETRFVIPDPCHTPRTNTLMYRTNALYSQMHGPECTALNNVEFGCISGWPRFSCNEKLEDSCAVLSQKRVDFVHRQHEQHVEDTLMRYEHKLRVDTVVSQRILAVWNGTEINRKGALYLSLLARLQRQ